MTQTEEILAHLEAGNQISPLQALKKFDCLRLGARIYDLRKDGHDIQSTTYSDPKTGKHYSIYWLRTKKRGKAA